MNMIHIAMIFVAIVAINIIVTSVMNFLGVELQSYGSYLLWLFAIIIFWGFLPGQTNYFS
jgi:hypothetical protein